MNRRLRSMELLKLLQPFTQAGILSPADAKGIVDDFVKGEGKKLKSFIYSPDIPVAYNNVAAKLLQFI